MGMVIIRPYISVSKLKKIKTKLLYGMKFPPILHAYKFVFAFLVNYVIVSCDLPYYNSFHQWMLLKN